MKRWFDPYWLALYLLVGGFLAVLWWVMSSPLSQTDQTAVGVCLVLVLSGLLHLWIGVTDAARLQDGVERRWQRGASTGRGYTYVSRREYDTPVSISGHLNSVVTDLQTDETSQPKTVGPNGYHGQSLDLPQDLRRKE